MPKGHRPVPGSQSLPSSANRGYRNGKDRVSEQVRIGVEWGWFWTKKHDISVIHNCACCLFSIRVSGIYRPVTTRCGRPGLVECSETLSVVICSPTADSLACRPFLILAVCNHPTLNPAQAGISRIYLSSSPPTCICANKNWLHDHHSRPSKNRRPSADSTGFHVFAPVS